ncbi:MAG TPA: ATP-binding protein [Chitinophagaceae bacterium]|nr:ATP-binding protein [Chitinophagaceae bacterium]
MIHRKITGEEQDILRRFAVEFERTYTRFLDLQKAEAQAREAEIELALERVRARTMAMHKSEELKKVIQVVYEQFVHLNILVEHAGFIIDYKESEDMNIWLADKHAVPFRVTIPYFDCAHWNSFNEAKEKARLPDGQGLDFFVNHLSFEEKNKFYQDLFKLIPGVPEETLDYYLSCPGLAISTVLLDNIGLYIENFSGTPYNDDENKILMRFGKVFQQTYTRFLDLQKAEAQAMEAKIEAGLERLRSKTMAMQHSNELREVVAVAYHELEKLDFDIRQCVIAISNNEAKNVEWWSTGFKEKILPNSYLIADDNPFVADMIKDFTGMIEKNIRYREWEMAGDKKKKFDQLIFEHTDLKNLPEEVKAGMMSVEKLFLSDAFMKYGMLEVVGLAQLPIDKADTLQRFATVFEQTYTRFLDLQKAEAQAREAKIEAALERIRSVSMAIRKSNELFDIIRTVFGEWKKLGLELYECNINLLDRTKKEWTNWGTGIGEAALPRSFQFPWFDNPFVTQLYDDSISGISYRTYMIEGEELNRFLDAMFIHTDFKNAPEEYRNQLYSISKIYLSHAFMQYGSMDLVGPEQPPASTIDILKRFAKVFEQAYTRYLDVVNAETQAREAQIEAALERVRSKTMAMHNSQDVGATVTSMFEELVKLGVHKTVRCGIGILKDTTELELWTAYWGEDDSVSLVLGRIDTSIHPLLSGAANAWKNNESTFAYELQGEDLINYYKVLNDAPHYDFHVDISSLPAKLIHNSFYFPDGTVFAFAREPLTVEMVQIFKRFAAVFGQTYRRYLDLLKAEANTREAQIEASLERVRSKAMAMHNSQDLADTIGVFYSELKSFSITPRRCGVGLLNKENKEGELFTWNTTEQGESLELVGKIKMEGHPVLENVYKGWLAQTDYYPVLRGNEIKEYYKIIRPMIAFPDYNHDEVQYGYFFFFKEGGVYAWTEKEMAEDELQIYRRFTSVLSLTYKRFKDLQQAEAQAREAQIEAALERVRSKAMAMHKSEDINPAIAVVFEEMEKLNLGTLRCGIGILNKEKRTGDVWTTHQSETGSKIHVSGNESLDIHPLLQGAYDAWLRLEDFSYVLIGEDLNTYYSALTKTNFQLPESQLVLTASEEAKQYYYVAPFEAGTLFAFRETAFPEEAKAVMKRFANVFNLTYKRFLDIQKAEAQAREAKIEVALERVRARALAMQQPEELKAVAQVLRNEMGALGVEELETASIYIHGDSSENAECWYALQDPKHTEKRMISDHFVLNLDDTWVGSEMKKFYQSAETQTSVVMQGDNRKEWIEYCYKHSPVFTGFYGETIPDRTYHLYKFSHGYIGAAAPGGISDESWKLLSRAASVFSLAYSRFKDLTKAKNDLIKLKEEKKRAEDALTELQVTQKQLIQSEKMASLGELTAGIAHEIQNPLNFVNNFSEVSKELLDEMREAIEKGNTEDIKEIMNDVIQNLEKINHHGKRADGIVKGMLQHSRSNSGQKEPTDINALADEYLRLAYHGLRAKDKSFNATMKTDFDESIGNINIIPQDIGRVILNLITNAFYVVDEKKKQFSNYEPIVSVTTRSVKSPLGDLGVLISVKDNGNGIPQKVLDKIFQPFFTTKPTGQGTGLGLSLSYDIVKVHGGEIKVNTKEGEGSEFIIQLRTN